ncbi:MAG: hypothetical protein WCF85_18250 [Rhodospirillaceae bacterium]
MATKTFLVPNFSAGLFMCWDMYTQAGYRINVTLKDSATTYVNASKQSTSIMPALAEGNSNINGSNLQIIVDIPQSSSIQPSLNAYTIARPDGSIAGYGFNLNIEDATDQDYNDLYISMTAWKSKG